jgi:Holliday junction resolvase RusA-like endonuclease
MTDKIITISLTMALAPIPSLKSDPDAREVIEDKIRHSAKVAMAEKMPLLTVRQPLRGPLSLTMAMVYPPAASQRKSHDYRIVAPDCWSLARFICPLLSGIVFAFAGQVAELVVRKTYGAGPATIITVRQLIA